MYLLTVLSHGRAVICSDLCLRMTQDDLRKARLEAIAICQANDEEFEVGMQARERFKKCLRN